MRHVFLLGRSRLEQDMVAVQKEQMTYGDIIMHDYLDAYANLTLKTLSALRWTVVHCATAR